MGSLDRKIELRKYPKEFSRISTAELFNTPHTFPQGVLGQYASVHILEDIINFSKFLLKSGILDSKQTASFLTGSVLIPACNMGIFRNTTLRQILMNLRDAAEFIKTSYFIPRVGYQRRVLGFLLERLHSYLILARIQSGLSDANFGHHIILSDGPSIGITTELLTERNSQIAGRGAHRRKITLFAPSAAAPRRRKAVSESPPSRGGEAVPESPPQKIRLIYA